MKNKKINISIGYIDIYNSISKVGIAVALTVWRVKPKRGSTRQGLHIIINQFIQGKDGNHETF